MALPAHLLEWLPAQVRRGEPAASTPSVLPLGIPDLDAVLPDGGLPRGTVIELSAASGPALGTSVSLLACRAAQDEAVKRGGAVPFCAFVDPAATLHGPGVSGLGVRLERLLVVRPPLEAIGRTAIRLAESQAFAVVVVDTLSVPGAPLEVSLGTWPRIVRRLSIAAEESGACIVILTDGDARRPLPLPVGMRVELARPAADRLSVRVAKERRGRVGAPRTLQWSSARAKALGIAPDPAVPGQRDTSSRTVSTSVHAP
jgi:recombination protein RecA